LQIDLSKAAGLPISIDLDTGRLIATGEVDLGEQGERRLSQLREVLADPDAATDDRVCYRTYRGVGTAADLELLDQHGVRYDVTVTLPGLIGREFTKTAGHYHSKAPVGVVYPELYEVIHGTAAFVLQDGPGGCSWVQTCKPGERIVIPDGCGHVTVNIGKEPLVVCDLVASECTNDYGFFRANRGAAYYVVEDTDGFMVEVNPRYVGMKSARVDSGSRWPDIIPDDEPLIKMFRRNPGDFRLLTAPMDYSEIMFDLWNR